MAVSKRILEFIPLALISVGYWAIFLFQTPLLGLDRYALTRMFMLEFLAIHCFPFAMLLVMWRPTHDKVLGLKWFWFGVLVLFYSLGARSISGWLGVMGLGFLICTTYFGFLLGSKSATEIPQLIMRGSVNLALFIFCAAFFDTPRKVNHWLGTEAVFRAGLTYFSLLAILELSGIYHSPWLRKKGERFRTERAKEWKSKDPFNVRVKTAAFPLLASAGLGIAPYIFLPMVVGFGGRMIDNYVEWPRSVQLIRFWYLFGMALPLLSVRYWQFRLGSPPRKGAQVNWKFRTFGFAFVILLFGGLGIYEYFDGKRIVFEPFWAFEEIAIFFVPDFFLSLVLTPRAWFMTGNK